MCGLTGFFDPRARHGREDATRIVRRMSDTLRHRGPDDAGDHVEEGSGIALGFRRLAIVDLSEAGHQPMTSASRRYVISFNGEVYNFERVRSELSAAGLAPPFRGHSDTEVILAAVEAWGLRAAVERFIGMFAFALWDRETRRVHLVRDRVGVKPLYLGRANGTFVFGSELKALRAFPGFDTEVDRGALALLMRHNYIGAPHTIYRHARKVMPGSILTIDSAGQTSEETYWSAADAARRGVQHPFTGSAEDAVNELDTLLRDSVALRMIADVPLGVFLSGGIDSSVVTALMQAQSSRPVRTFSIGFHEQIWNEAGHAKEVARHLGTDHTELYVSSQQALDVIPLLPAMYDEPFSDSSQIPTHLVSKMARQHVTVSLSGDGGDELFAGYNRYVWGRNVWKRLRLLPRAARSGAARALKAVSPDAWERVFAQARRVAPKKLVPQAAGDKIHKLADVLSVRTPEEMYWRLVSHWKEPLTIVKAEAEPRTLLTDPSAVTGIDDFTLRMMYLDLVTYLPDDILAKVDRASMAVSLEAREPLLDHRLIELAWRLPLDMKLRDGDGKWALRQVLYRYVPRDLLERPKMGFAVPLDLWLRGPLREWAEELLSERRLEAGGYFHAAPVRKVWAEHLSGSRNWQYHLWNVLMFQAWEEASRQSPAGSESPAADEHHAVAVR